MKEVLQKRFPAIVLILIFLAGYMATSAIYSVNYVSAVQTRPLALDNNRDIYLVTCDNGKKHTIIANPAEQDFQYYYPNKGYYIKYYDMEFQDRKDFAAWVCRNK